MDETYWKHLEQMDSASLQRLMSAYGQEVWNLAFLLTKRHHLADDIAQDVFIKAYESIHQFRGASGIKTWLLSITRNISINYLRTAFVRKVTLTGWITDKGVNASAEKQAVEQSVTEEIWRAVMGLPLKLREVLILHGKYELSMKEIANVLGVSEGTVKSRLARARGRCPRTGRRMRRMNEFEPGWYNKLKSDPVNRRTFTAAHMEQIQQQAAKLKERKAQRRQKARRKRLAAGAAVLVIFIGLVLNYGKLEKWVATRWSGGIQEQVPAGPSSSPQPPTETEQQRESLIPVQLGTTSGMLKDALPLTSSKLGTYLYMTNLKIRRLAFLESVNLLSLRISLGLIWTRPEPKALMPGVR